MSTNDSHETRPAREVLRTALARRRRRQRIAPMSVFPTMCTLGNLIAGFAAIHYASKPVDYAGPWDWTGLTFAAILIFIGMIFDAFDGSIARLTNSTSELGAQLDSLADMVTFGIAPAYLATVLIGRYVAAEGDINLIGPEVDSIFGRLMWGIAAAYVCCAALRLARFNVETPDASVESHLVFRGLPSPGAAGAVASLILLHQHLSTARFAEDVPIEFIRGSALAIQFIVILCAFGMVSSLPYVHVINRYARGRRSFGYVVLLVVPLVIFIWSFHYVLAIGFCAYAISAPAQRLWRLIRQRSRSAAAPA